MDNEAIDAVAREQLSYYSAGAAEYDRANRVLVDGARDTDWEAAYSRGYRDALHVMKTECRGKDVLELAGGTGFYSEWLAEHASQLTIVDASAEALEINRTTVGENRKDIKYVLADIFEWQPSRTYDVVVFAFWHSHVPLARFERFWRTVSNALRVGGTAIIVDSRADPTGRDSRSPAGTPEVFIEERIDDEVCVRQLADGRRFRIVRVLWDIEVLRARLNGLGWDTTFQDSSPWLIGRGKKRAFPESFEAR